MKKADATTLRTTLTSFQQIINVGPALEADFKALGLKKPADLIGKDPVQLYVELCQSQEKFHDPCVLDCFLAVVDYMDGNPPQPWWNYTPLRKDKYTLRVQELQSQYSR